MADVVVTTDVQEWTMDEARAKFDELLGKARTEGPQRIAGADVVFLSTEQFERLAKREPTFVEWLLSIPKSDDDGELFVRDRSPMREYDWD